MGGGRGLRDDGIAAGQHAWNAIVPLFPEFRRRDTDVAAS
jgi:hypothetical protein